MKPFRFSLQAIETLRERAEHSALEQLAAALRGQRSAEERLAGVHRRIEVHQQKHRQLISTAAPVHEVQRHGAWMEVLREEQSRTNDACMAARRSVAAAASAVQSARQARETISRCHERQRLAHQSESRRQEQMLLDELSAARHLRAVRERKTALP